MRDFLGNTIQDLRFAIRQLRRSGAFTLTVILTLALGIGLNAAIFTMVDCVLLRPLGYHDANRIYGINSRFTEKGRSIPRVGGADFTDLANKVSSLESAAYYNFYQDGIQAGSRMLYTDIGMVSPQFGQVMGVEPVAGRLFLTNNNSLTNPEEAMVSAAFARQQFGSAAQALGQSLKYYGKLRVIVGVLPDGFSFPGKTKVWIEAPSAPDVANRTSYNQQAIVKVKPGVPAEQLSAEMATFSRQLQAAYPEDKLKALDAVSLQEQLVGKIRPTLRLLMGSVIVVLLIVCANITHLQLVRATRLRREVTIRAALGATRSALARRAGLEVLLLAIGGCAVGVLIALPALKLLVELAPTELPRLGDVRLNFDVIGFSFVVSLLTMGLTALLPLWRSWRVDPASAMKQDSARGMETRASGRLRQGLIVGEVALTLMLSVAALLLVRQLIAESQQDLGFTAERLVMLDTHMSPHISNPNPTSLERFAVDSPDGQADVASLNLVLARLGAVPGVANVAAVSGAPMTTGGSNVGYAIKGKSDFKPGVVDLPNANIFAMTPGYLETMGIPVLRGRGITAADLVGSEPVVVISESLAKQSFPGEDPIGKQIKCGWDYLAGWITIVGVVGDVRQDSPASVPYPTFYAPLSQHSHAATDMQVMVRTKSDAGAMSATLEKFMKQNFPEVAVLSSTMRENVGESERAQHFRTLLFGSFAGVSILLAMIGMYGVTAYTVAQRRFEFALRFALGAQRGQVLGSVLQRALGVAGAGVIFGVGLSLGLMRVIGTLLGKMPEFDAVSYAIAAGGVLAIALSATLLPAYRAATVEPMQVLRNE
jgi:putative ABC transport system permease protein